jgi:iron(III) transport system ATP-binding protein
VKPAMDRQQRSPEVGATHPDGSERRSGLGVEISHLEKSFRRASGELVQAVDGVSLEVRAGEMLVLLGPSGCGKTTLLRCLAGVEHPDAGTIRIGDRDMSSASEGERRVFVPPEKRRLSMIFQSYALWPHMTAFDNVAYPLRVRGRMPRDEIKDRVTDSLKLVGIGDLAGQHPSAMSGGQQQRVALARAIVGGDGLVLFDEPLSNVDAKVREELRFEIMEMHQRLGFTGVYVTHDQHEALAIASRIAVMERGKVAQLDEPRAVYEHPVSRYVATFIGTTNELTGVIGRHEGDHHLVHSGLGEITATAAEALGTLETGSEVTIVSRPEAWQMRRAEPDEAADGVNSWVGEISHIQFAGSYLDVSVVVEGHTISIWEQQISAELEVGQRVVVQIHPGDARVVI